MFGSKSVEDMLDTVKNTVPEGLTYAFNLGHVDVFPVTSGKENAAKYIMERFDASPASSFLLCDDDNDLGASSAAMAPGSQQQWWCPVPHMHNLPPPAAVKLDHTFGCVASISAPCKLHVSV